MITPRTEGRIAFIQLASDSVKNLIFFGLGLAVIIWIGSYFRWLGLLLFGVYALITIVNTGSVLISAIVGVFLFALKLITLRLTADEFWWHLANIVQVIEGAVHVLYCAILYRFFFPAAAA